MSLHEALQSRSTKIEVPFLRWEIDQPFSEQAIQEVVLTDIPESRQEYDGTRAGDAKTKVATANTRCFITPANVHKYPALGALVDDLLSADTIGLCSEMLRRQMQGFLRVEVICDREGFWLEPHKDIKEKGLSEKAIYLAALAANPQLSLMDKNSVRYTGPEQLQQLGF